MVCILLQPVERRKTTMRKMGLEEKYPAEEAGIILPLKRDRLLSLIFLSSL